MKQERIGQLEQNLTLVANRNECIPSQWDTRVDEFKLEELIKGTWLLSLLLVIRLLRDALAGPSPSHWRPGNSFVNFTSINKQLEKY